VSDIRQTDKEKKMRRILPKILKLILIISIVSSVFFVLNKNIKKSIIALIIIVFLSVIIGFLIITKILVKQPVYGIVSEKSSHANIYVIPEETATIKFIAENGETVRIIGEKDQFYLIETDAKGSRGWAKKENILLE
jgi:SH3-like domain-containing protein